MATSLQTTSGKRCGFTTVEMLVCLIILALVSKVVVDVISRTEANARADRAARETMAAIRFARNLAMTTGNSSGVEFNTTTNKVQVYTMISGTQTWVTAAFVGSGKSGRYEIDLANDREVKGVTMTVTIATDTTNPYSVLFTPLGATKNTGTVRFNYSGTSKTLTIPALADPTLN